MGGQSDADPHLLSQAAAIQGERLQFLPVMENLQGNERMLHKPRAKSKAQNIGFPAKQKRKA
jgi:hypothetical protein